MGVGFGFFGVGGTGRRLIGDGLTRGFGVGVTRLLIGVGVGVGVERLVGNGDGGRLDGVGVTRGPMDANGDGVGLGVGVTIWGVGVGLRFGSVVLSRGLEMGVGVGSVIQRTVGLGVGFCPEPGVLGAIGVGRTLGGWIAGPEDVDGGCRFVTARIAGRLGNGLKSTIKGCVRINSSKSMLTGMGKPLAAGGTSNI